mmetsp:Transcript_33911/g.69308  ORF Transcript_33911/g.69308 Transcript_33911/m.69308 type:complete len:238 (+) Transcript_33911:253-966(+)
MTPIVVDNFKTSNTKWLALLPPTKLLRGTAVRHGTSLQKNARQRQELLRSCHVSTLPEVVVVVLLNLVQNLGVNVPRRLHGHAAGGVQHGDASVRLAVVVARPLDQVLHQVPVVVVHFGVQDLRFRDPELVHVFLREVDAPSHRVLANVPKDVCDLEANAKCDGRILRLLFGVTLGSAHDGEGHEAHGGGDAVAVHVQLVPGLVPVFAKLPGGVHFHAFDHVQERVDVQGRVPSFRV